MGKARVKFLTTLLDKPRSGWEHIIDEYIKDEDDKVAIDKDGIHVDDGDVDITIETEEDN